MLHFCLGFTMLIWSKGLNWTAGQVLAYCFRIARLLRSLVLSGIFIGIFIGISLHYLMQLTIKAAQLFLSGAKTAPRL